MEKEFFRPTEGVFEICGLGDVDDPFNEHFRHLVEEGYVSAEKNEKGFVLRVRFTEKYQEWEKVFFENKRAASILLREKRLGRRKKKEKDNISATPDLEKPFEDEKALRELEDWLGDFFYRVPAFKDFDLQERVSRKKKYAVEPHFKLRVYLYRDKKAFTVFGTAEELKKAVKDRFSKERLRVAGG